MAFVSLRQMLDHAAENGYGVPAFNVNNLEQIQAIMEAAALTDSPVILQASAGARKYAGEAYLRHMVLAAVETYPDIPVVMHQDHGTTAAVCQQSIRSGFTSIFARTGAGLQNDRAVGGSSGFHDGLNLFQVVDIKSWHAVAVFGGVVEHLTKGNKGHGDLLVVLEKESPPHAQDA